MNTTPKLDKHLYSKAGVSGLDPKTPLKIEEKHHAHRSASDCECHDCGRLLVKGEPMVVSSIECTQGVKGRTHRYEVHLACYDVVGEVVNALGKDATHTWEGRPPLSQLWAEHHKAIRKADKALAAKLEAGFGKP